MRVLPVTVIAVLMFVATANAADFQYVSPVPNSTMVSPGTNIILRGTAPFSQESASQVAVVVRGAVTGEHEVTTKLADGNKVLLVTPVHRFEAGEKVSVQLLSSLRDINNESYDPLDFEFVVSRGIIEPDVPADVFDDVPHGGTPPLSGTGTMLDLPRITVTHSDNPSPGYIFLSNVAFSSSVPNVPHILMVDNAGQIVFARQMGARVHDFKLQPNGLYTYYDHTVGHFVALNSAREVVDSFQCGNGYSTDEHELRILPNGHALLMSYDAQVVRMDTIVPGGQPNAVVIGLVVQELDQNRNVVFQWRSWDNFRIEDATYINFTTTYIDAVHGNALEMDYDGNILLSSRHLDEITKINRETGAIVWRLGGQNNQFTFLNDPIKFSRQHAIRRLPNGNITLFDNGNYHSPAVSRAVEYELDETQKTAERVWSYQDPSGTYGYAMGYAQRLENGNTLIGWGSTNPTVTEVRPNGEKAFEMTFPAGVFSYRAYRFNLAPTAVGAPSSAIPSSHVLEQNFPNPFNPSTTIRYHLATGAPVRLTVYDLLGREIRRLVDEPTEHAGVHEVAWDGRDEKGISVASGIYIYQLKAGGVTQTRRMVLMK